MLTHRAPFRQAAKALVAKGGMESHLFVCGPPKFMELMVCELVEEGAQPEVRANTNNTCI
jgi:NAD(P)H-flavin reductase